MRYAPRDESPDNTGAPKGPPNKEKTTWQQD